MAIQARQVVERLRAGLSLDGLGISKVDGRWDLRGVHFSAVATRQARIAGVGALEISGADELTSVRLEGLDLTGAHWPHLRLRGVTVADCIFDGATLPGLVCSSTSVQDSSFADADLRSAMMSGPSSILRSRNSSWVDVDFSGADLRDSAHISETYTRCAFDGAMLSGVDFQGSRHSRSSFSGRMEDVIFRSRAKISRHSGPENVMQDVDLSRAELVGCGFWGLDLSAVRLPSSSTHVVTLPKVDTARKILDALRHEDPEGVDLVELRVMSEYHIKEGPDAPFARGVMHLEVLGRNDGERARARAVIDKAQASRPE